MRSAAELIELIKNVRKPSSPVKKDCNNLLCIHPSDRSLVDKLQLDSYNGIIAGGAARLWWSGMPVTTHDIDIWLPKKAGVMNLKKCIEVLNFIGSRQWETPNAITYEVDEKSITYKVQLIKAEYSTPKEMLDDFDITVCKIATDGKSWIVGDNFVEDLKTKTLRMTKFKHNSMRRLFKYMIYGFQPVDGLIESMLENPNVSKDFSGEDDDEYKDAQ